MLRLAILGNYAPDMGDVVNALADLARQHTAGKPVEFVRLDDLRASQHGWEAELDRLLHQHGESASVIVQGSSILDGIQAREELSELRHRGFFRIQLASRGMVPSGRPQALHKGVSAEVSFNWNLYADMVRAAMSGDSKELRQRLEQAVETAVVLQSPPGKRHVDFAEKSGNQRETA